ncbi:MAG: hypothetical protein J6T84_10395 [Spirochaetaceae bacterium]|nr:hypothetical protein [Spirochaetaceae bacterium]
MKRLSILLCICFIFIEPVFSFSRKIETFYIMNYTKQNIIVEREFFAGIAIEERNYFLTQPVGDLTLAIQDTLWGTNVIKPHNYGCLHAICPSGGAFVSGSHYNEMLAIPFMEKINTIYKKFTILKEDGSVVLTLDTLLEQLIKRSSEGGETAYFLEIFDDEISNGFISSQFKADFLIDINKLEAKPASQW